MSFPDPDDFASVTHRLIRDLGTYERMMLDMEQDPRPVVSRYVGLIRDLRMSIELLSNPPAGSTIPEFLATLLHSKEWRH